MSELITSPPRSRPLPSAIAKACLVMAMLSPVRSEAAPFRLGDSSQLRTDFTASWASFSSTHNTAVPDGVAFAASDGGAGIFISSAGTADLTIWNQSAGVMLADPGPDGIVITLNRAVQGVGLIARHRNFVAAQYQMEFQDAAGAHLFSVTAQGAAGTSTYLGGVDPDARIRKVIITASPGNFFLITNPAFQLKRAPVTDLSTLPVASEQTLDISPAATYLHQGLGNMGTDGASEAATTTNENAFNLSALFPSLRGGDMIHAQRLGMSSSQLLAVFSRTQVLADGTSFHRVPGAIPAGNDFYTAKVAGRTFDTPTNIPQDFLIGSSTFIKIPSGAAYLFFSLASPGPSTAPAKVRLSHVPRSQFAEWAASFGLHGNLADPNSDLDGDGLTLLEEFAFLKDPTAPDAGKPTDYAFTPNASVSTGNPRQLTLLFGARLDGPLRYKAQFSSDLKNWNTVESSGVVPFYPDESDSSRSIFSVTDPNPGANRFGRIRIEQITPSNP